MQVLSEVPLDYGCGTTLQFQVLPLLIDLNTKMLEAWLEGQCEKEDTVSLDPSLPRSALLLVSPQVLWPASPGHKGVVAPLPGPGQGRLNSCGCGLEAEEVFLGREWGCGHRQTHSQHCTSSPASCSGWRPEQGRLVQPKGPRGVARDQLGKLWTLLGALVATCPALAGCTDVLVAAVQGLAMVVGVLPPYYHGQLDSLGLWASSLEMVCMRGWGTSPADFPMTTSSERLLL